MMSPSPYLVFLSVSFLGTGPHRQRHTEGTGHIYAHVEKQQFSLSLDTDLPAQNHRILSLVTQFIYEHKRNKIWNSWSVLHKAAWHPPGSVWAGECILEASSMDRLSSFPRVWSQRKVSIPRFWKDGWGDRTGLRLLHFHPSMGSSLRSPTLVHCTPKDGNGDVCQWVTLGLQSQTAALPGLSDRTVHSAQCQPGKKQPDSPSFQEMG